MTNEIDDSKSGPGSRNEANNERELDDQPRTWADFWRDLSLAIAEGYPELRSGWYRFFFYTYNPSVEETHEFESWYALEELSPEKYDFMIKEMDCSPEELAKCMFAANQAVKEKYYKQFQDLFVDELPKKIVETLETFLEEIGVRALSELRPEPVPSPSGQTVANIIVREKDRVALIEPVLNTSKKTMRERMKAPKRGGSSPDYDLAALGDHYRHLHAIWKEAKRLYKQNKHLNWIQIIKAAYPQLNDDLISQLSYPSKELPSTLFDAIAKTNGTSKPSDIALEDAARHCGCPPYHYAIGTLWQTLRTKER